MTFYTYNSTTQRLTKEPAYIVTDEGTIVNPSAEQYATLRDAYPKGEDAPLPEPQEGKVVEYNGYALCESDHLWHKQWILVDAPTPPPRTFSKYKLVAALMQAEVWPQVKAWIEGTPGAYDLYLAAEDISEDEPLLAQGITAVKELLSWTDEQVEAVLAQAAI